MVMAGSEGVSGSATDEPLSSRLQWLRQRREALQEKLSLKNNELKSLCIEEAELTGVLPPEIPLEPGESPPNFRKRLAASITYPQNIINKLKTNGAEESALELERQVQINIAEAALAKLNDPSESKPVRRKHRSIYQQSQRRLQELNAQLNFIRQSHGSGLRQSGHISLHGSQSHLQGSAKHRTKKPRPPLESAGKDLSPKVESRNFLQEGGISLSPLGPEHNFNTYPNYDFQDLSNHGYPSNLNQNRSTFPRPTPSPVEQHRRSNADLNANNNIYVPPEHFRNRAYSQGGNSSKSISPQLQFPPERPYRPVPNTYTEEERMQIRQMKMKRQGSEDIARSPQYPDPRYLDNEVHRRSAQISYPEADYGVPRYDGRMTEYGHYHHEKSQNPPVLRPRENLDNKPAMDMYMPPGHWMRLDDEIVWCTDDQTPQSSVEKFGSLDRRKHHTYHHHSPNHPEIQSRYHTVAIGGKNSTAIPHSRPYPVQPPMHSPDTNNPPSSNRILIRTQSLGSVEAWPQQPNSPTESEGHESVDRPPKPKPKEWYESSLDTGGGGGGGGPLPPRAVRRASQHNPLPVKERAPPVRSNSIPSNRRLREVPPPPPQQVDEPRPPPVPRFEGRVLEIPAESKPSPGSQENGNETIIPLNSPTNHTVVQPGKYQPYREVTKPFEMSDFYKYSTKYRKRVEANEQQQQQSPQQQQQQTPVNVNTQNDQNNSMQRIHPVQRNNFNMR